MNKVNRDGRVGRRLITGGHCEDRSMRQTLGGSAEPNEVGRAIQDALDRRKEGRMEVAPRVNGLI